MEPIKHPLWQIIVESAKKINKNEFTDIELIREIQSNFPEINETSIRSHLIGMSPNHPSSIHMPLIRSKHPVFYYQGKGTYKIASAQKEIFEVEKKEQFKKSETQIPVLVDKDNSPIINDIVEIGNFYILISSFEKEIRHFIKFKIGKGFYKRLNNEMSNLIKSWEDRQRDEEKWGIKSEDELINYALITDYMEIIKKYKNIFTDGGDEEVNEIIQQLKQITNYGRNPLMHCRTLTLQKYYTTISSVNYIKEWMKRKNT